MRNVLVFPCGSEIGLEIHRSLSSSPHFTLYGASTVPDHGRFAYKHYRQINSMADDPGFEAEMNALIEDLCIDFVMPAHDEAILRIAQLQTQNRLAAEAVTPPFDACAVCRSKQATYRLFRDAMRVPRIYSENEFATAPWPLFGKPDKGQGSRGAELLPDEQAAREKLRRSPDTVIMEFLPGPEYTVDCFTDKSGALLFRSARARARIAGGISVHSRAADHPSLMAMATAINDLLPMRGAWFFQARENAAGEAALLEIAPRIAGSSGFQRARGVNLALLSLYDRVGLPLRVAANSLGDMETDRALATSFALGYDFEAAYIDFDDTLFSSRFGVNSDAVKFIFQCRNRGKKVTLLSRHLGDLDATLRETGLAGLCDNIVHIRDNTSKAEYIREKKAVFIDDSFAEREDVAKRLGIPVFDPSSFDALFDPKSW